MPQKKHITRLAEKSTYLYRKLKTILSMSSTQLAAEFFFFFFFSVEVCLKSSSFCFVVEMCFIYFFFRGFVEMCFKLFSSFFYVVMYFIYENSERRGDGPVYGGRVEQPRECLSPRERVRRRLGLVSLVPTP